MQTTRWRRYGHDRLYVKDDEGKDVGWWDLAAGRAHPESPDLLELLTATVTRWQQANRDRAPTAVAPMETPSNSLGPSAGPYSLPPTGDDRRWTTPSTTVPSPMPLHSPDMAPQPPLVLDSTTPSGSVDPPSATDLGGNRPGEQLSAHIAAAHQAGQRATLLRRIFLGKRAYSTWERGAIGERLVAEELDSLARQDPRWLYLNSIPVGYNDSDIDHLIVGPGGVFSINAKYHRGAKVWVGGDTVMVNGTRVPYVRNSRHEARRASRLLSAALRSAVVVRGVIVPVDAADFTVRQQPNDIHVVNRKRLNRLIERRDEPSKNSRSMPARSTPPMGPRRGLPPARPG